MANGPGGNPNQNARDHRGHYVRTLEAAERDAEAARLHAHGYTDGMIAVLLGYPSARAAGFGRRKILAEIERAPVEEIIKVETQKLDLELVRLEELERTVRRVLDAEHITVSNGNVITDPRTGQPLADDDPLLRAADRLIRIEDARRRNAERRAKLLGLDAEQKVSVSGSVRYEVVGVDPADLT